MCYSTSYSMSSVHASMCSWSDNLVTAAAAIHTIFAYFVLQCGFGCRWCEYIPGAFALVLMPWVVCG
eukprot:m.1668402 g.1668402  ORF g.1668402 m.1668402 type:complete len:67 (-) comp152736_c0_seq1:26-226(-)